MILADPSCNSGKKEAARHISVVRGEKDSPMDDRKLTRVIRSGFEEIVDSLNEDRVSNATEEHSAVPDQFGTLELYEVFWSRLKVSTAASNALPVFEEAVLGFAEEETATWPLKYVRSSFFVQRVRCSRDGRDLLSRIEWNQVEAVLAEDSEDTPSFWRAADTSAFLFNCSAKSRFLSPRIETHQNLA